MIVKDEEKVIKRSLESVKPLIDYWIIVDTGSTDHTKEIIQEVMKDIPGVLYDSTWKDFGTNRTEAFEYAKDQAEYVLFIDADDWLEYPTEYTFPELTKDAYQMWRGSEGFTYLKPQLVKTSLPWKWIGVMHEYLTCYSLYTSEILENVRYIAGDSGARSSDGEKFLKNIHLLEEGLAEEPTNSRYMFYLAESYRDAGNLEKAIECYQKRIKMDGWNEEVYWSFFQIAKLKQMQGGETHAVIDAFARAHRERPHRIEPIYYLAEIFNQLKKYELAYECIKGQNFLPQPATKDILFNEKWIESWGLLLQLSISSFYLGYYQESLDICDKLLSIALPENVRLQVILNRTYAEKKLSWNERFIFLDGRQYDTELVSKLVTVITTANPIPSIPDTHILYQSQASLFRIPALAQCKKIIVFDGVQPGYEARKADYEEYKQNIIQLTQKDPLFSNTNLVFCPTWVHLSGAIAEAIKYVKTPFVFIHQHDFVLQKSFDFNACIATMMANPEIKHLRLNRGLTNTTFREWDGEIDQVIQGVSFVPLCRTFGWSDNDHLARVDYYTQFVLPKCHCCAVEHVLHPALKNAIAEKGKEAHALFGTYLYGMPSDGGYFHHLDGREAWGK